MPGTIVNKADLAAIFGVSVVAVDQWIGKGCPFSQKGSKGVGYEFDTAAVIEWRTETALKKVTEAGAKASKDPSQRKLTAEAALAELKLDRELGKLLPADEVEKTWDRLTTTCRARLLSIPSGSAPAAFAAESEEDVRLLIEEALHSALNELSRQGDEAQAVIAGDAQSAPDETTLPTTTASKANRKRVGRPKKTAKPRVKRNARKVDNSKS